jgi:hypothetical protein
MRRRGAFGSTGWQKKEQTQTMGKQQINSLNQMLNHGEDGMPHGAVLATGVAVDVGLGVSVGAVRGKQGKAHSRAIRQATTTSASHPSLDKTQIAASHSSMPIIPW